MQIIELINQNMQIFSRAKILVINLAELFFTCKVRDKSPFARQAPSPNSDRLRFFFSRNRKIKPDGPCSPDLSISEI